MKYCAALLGGMALAATLVLAQAAEAKTVSTFSQKSSSGSGWGGGSHGGDYGHSGGGGSCKDDKYGGKSGKKSGCGGDHHSGGGGDTCKDDRYGGKPDKKSGHLSYGSWGPKDCDDDHGDICKGDKRHGRMWDDKYFQIIHGSWGPKDHCDDDDDDHPSAVPLPASGLVLLSGIGLMAGLRKRRRR
jgi:hypothetical protein